jgi:hypothetical protein
VLGVNLPDGLRANPAEPRGRAAWLSITAAIIRAAASHLQINSTELAAGIRPWIDFSGRLQAEMFVYETLPNGASYASEVADDVEIILERARNLARSCPGECESACYGCLLDYGNQRQTASWTVTSPSTSSTTSSKEPLRTYPIRFTADLGLAEAPRVRAGGILQPRRHRGGGAARTGRPRNGDTLCAQPRRPEQRQEHRRGRVELADGGVQDL